ncbi:hypothetical protein Tco_0550109, partial [Tanacetum coccineum]
MTARLNGNAPFADLASIAAIEAARFALMAADAAFCSS